MRFVDFVDLAAQLFEGAGVVVMVVGAAVSVALALRDARGPLRAKAYRQLRHYLGRAILLGLELLVAADIIRTVAQSPTLRQVVILGLIVLIRTFLSFTLEVEIDGRWPWQSPPRGKDEAGPPGA
ncbi:DUF1622 domain-containing protein [Corallococcus sp. AB049A]|uniref:DUF1622 domain-containing protein n=1 Tax=Corallococcus interemptor TaxID=2316720 RepID=A0A3A8Q4N9_9BACT|nr:MULTISPECIES: DUF1622 domain-containing protein [Corallococcus]RKH42157.1 DUF1622 domain-containing protein [Corallococcus sp. AB050B]RKH59882.1 DUF1622 domain-containing protein [Corallococcus interemptor]RKI65400.1 DUF1622 domain-containing protein [Corallococcus sp. AB049A]